MSPVLEAQVTVGYGSREVARDVSVEVDEGEVCAIVGPNGAGKTTLLLTMAGLLPPIAGTISVGGRTMQAGSARQTRRAGVVLVPDNRALFTQLTAIENLEVARRNGGGSVPEVLELFPALREKAKIRAGALSGGEQQMLALARALVQQPRVLLIDEMSMGLAPLIVESLVSTIRDFSATTGTAIVLVEQHVRVALEASDHALVLVHGDVVLRGTSDEVANHPDLESAYLGAAVVEPVVRPR
jgi:branched-chain amino acid transport system ATP-binding protein